MKISEKQIRSMISESLSEELGSVLKENQGETRQGGLSSAGVALAGKLKSLCRVLEKYTKELKSLENDGSIDSTQIGLGSAAKKLSKPKFVSLADGLCNRCKTFADGNVLQNAKIDSDQPLKGLEKLMSDVNSFISMLGSVGNLNQIKKEFNSVSPDVTSAYRTFKFISTDKSATGNIRKDEKTASQKYGKDVMKKQIAGGESSVNESKIRRIIRQELIRAGY